MSGAQHAINYESGSGLCKVQTRSVMTFHISAIRHRKSTSINTFHKIERARRGTKQRRCALRIITARCSQGAQPAAYSRARKLCSDDVGVASIVAGPRHHQYAAPQAARVIAQYQ